LLVAALLPGVRVQGLAASVAAVTVIALVNALLWPLLVRFALRFLLLSLGVLALVLNGLVVLAADAVIGGLQVAGLGSAVLVALGLAAVNVAVSGLLSLDDASFYHGVIRRAERLTGGERSEAPGVFLLEIDGLSEPALRRAIARGDTPTLARWLEQGSHRLLGWECDLSCQTAASQAGLLLGDNTGIPAFRWYEKATGRLMVSSSRTDCAEIERRLSTGEGLLADGGVSVGNLLSGDAPRSLFTFSTASIAGRPQRDYLGFFANPYSVTRTVVLMLRDVAVELRAATGQRLRGERPRIRRTLKYALIRAGTTVALRDLSVATVMGNLFAGTRVGYATFFGYDEVAHHSGIERRDAMAVLRGLDGHIGRLERAAALAPRRYSFVVLSDHGQSQGATFRQRYGHTLEAVVRDALCEPRTTGSAGSAEEARAGIGAALADVAAEGGTLARAAARAEPRREAATLDGPGAVVLASGNLGLIYLTDAPGRLTLEVIDALHPGLVPALVAHPGVAFVRVRSGTRGALVLGPTGSRRLVDGAIAGEDPLAPFGPNAARHLLRHDGFANTPDLLVNSTFDPETGEVAAFEELVGSHGGLGGPQSQAFALVPSEWPAAPEPIVGAAAMHAALKTWLARP